MIERRPPHWFSQYIHSFTVSASIGLCYVLILELAQLLIGYDDGMSHSFVALFFYLIGIYVNYSIQKKRVFKANNAPIVKFLLYNLASALLVSILSGYLYTSPSLRSIFSQFIESASTAISLLIISPITYIVFKSIFKNQH